jgi:excisionase family DNA binding protein
MITSRPTTESSPSSMPYVLTLDEAAQLLRISPQTLEGLVSRGDVPGRKVEREYRFLRSALEAWLQGPQSRNTVLGLAGALKGDPYFPAVLDEIQKLKKKPVRQRN